MNVKNKRIESYLKPGSEVSTRIGRSKEDIKASFLENLFYGIGRIPALATRNDLYTALAITIRDRVFRQFVRSTEQVAEKDARAVAYLSAEYLPGPHLGNNLLNLDIVSQTRDAMAELHINLDEILEQEVEPGLGNGGLGRLASCYMDSLATLGIPSIAYGIRYEFGIFKQAIKDGWQVEETDKWLHYGNPWEIVRPDIAYEVAFGGRTEHFYEKELPQVKWIPDSVVKGTAYDTPILGYRANGIILRLWKAEAIESFDFSAFNIGNYYQAVQAKLVSENITKVLYPNDETLSGKELRLKQQYFFVSCSLQDIIYLHLRKRKNLKNLHKKFTLQLNDTHPSIAVAELMRLLVDIHKMEWTDAWEVTRNTFAYTNHTLLPEALEKWSVSLMGRLLPRHLEIIYEINARFLDELRRVHNYADDKIARMSLIDEQGDPCIRMAYLATLGSYKVNGVSALHSRLLKTQVLHEFAELWPDKFTNITNGVTHRRFLVLCNPSLAALITNHIGKEWMSELPQLEKLIPLADDPNLQKDWMQVKLANKKALALLIKDRMGIDIDPHMLFDVQVKRIHEYKRQHLKVLHILSLYLRHKRGQGESIAPCAFIFAGKAAPGYFMAKRIIKLINAVAALINSDPDLHTKMKVVFLPNFNVKQAQQVYPAADLSEQISLAGMEASGTGNMKFALNGALTVGTLDGANVEMREEVGNENFFHFGLSTEEVQLKRAEGYHPYKVYDQDPELREVIDFLISGKLANGDTELFRGIYDNLLGRDPYLLLEDFRSYVACQHIIHQQWRQPSLWARKSILNVAKMGKFSSDRSIQDYCETIWNITPVKVE